MSTNVINTKLAKLEEKYVAMGQDMESYLDGLLISNYLTYWDYVHVDKLLSLQNPKTDFPDEMIFIMYHQVTELYFKLVLHEMEQIANNGRIVMPSGQDMGWNTTLDPVFFLKRITRCVRYFEALTKSFDIMIDGMEPEQFLRFRMALLPASGFQSAQYRMIEICSTDLIRLVDKEVRPQFEGKDCPVEELFENIYWKKGATELGTGKKTLTLKQFEKKYAGQFIAMAKEYHSKNIWQKYLSLSQKDRNNPALIEALRKFDAQVNVHWPMVHLKSAARYLQKDPEDIAATGGTNWQKYLPPKHQRRVFYPTLWSEEELKNWGR
ncbi:MAG: tryptophan 2,3-dioxygenase [Bacteroidia bacterium]|nr:tryptophan 2,3-dioxygenase [Bacteroidia bacterium]